MSEERARIKDPVNQAKWSAATFSSNGEILIWHVCRPRRAHSPRQRLGVGQRPSPAPVELSGGVADLHARGSKGGGIAAIDLPA